MKESKVIFQTNILSNLPLLIEELKPSKVLVIYDEVINIPHHSSLITHHLSLKGGEGVKSIESVALLWEKMTEIQLDKDSVVLAVGGGSVTDVVGFAAGTFRRGIRCCFIPTTLLGMVDAAIGGKNGINFKGLKNQIGTVRQPDRVGIDVGFIKSLTSKQFAQGIAEIIKYGVIDKDFFDYLESHMDQLVNQDPLVLKEVIEKSIAIKQKIVKESEKEPEKRDILNFGHTFAHAIESASNHEISHGEAVSIGMMLAMKTSKRLQWLARTREGKDDAGRVGALLKRAGLPVTLPIIPVSAILSLMAQDKKGSFGKINLILAKEIGYVTKAPRVSEEILKAVMNE